jgi:hypothetical protein
MIAESERVTRPTYRLTSAPHKLSRDDDHIVVPNSAARVQRVPADGSCLFHALIYGLCDHVGAPANHVELRKTLIDWLEENPEAMVSGLPMRDWVAFEYNGRSVASYCAQMRGPGAAWGGAIEMAVYARLLGVAVHVYIRAPGGFRCISCFDVFARRGARQRRRRHCRAFHRTYVSSSPFALSPAPSSKSVCV